MSVRRPYKPPKIYEDFENSDESISEADEEIDDGRDEDESDDGRDEDESDEGRDEDESDDGRDEEDESDEGRDEDESDDGRDEEDESDDGLIKISSDLKEHFDHCMSNVLAEVKTLKERQEKDIKELKEDIRGIVRLLEKGSFRNSEDSLLTETHCAMFALEKFQPDSGTTQLTDMTSFLTTVAAAGGEALKNKLDLAVVKTKYEGLQESKEREDQLREELEAKALSALREERQRESRKFDRTVEELVTIRKEDRMDRLEEFEREKADREQERLKNEEEIKWLQSALAASEEKAEKQIREERELHEVEKERIRGEERKRRQEDKRMIEEERARERAEWERERQGLAQELRRLREDDRLNLGEALGAAVRLFS